MSWEERGPRVDRGSRFRQNKSAGPGSRTPNVFGGLPVTKDKSIAAARRVGHGYYESVCVGGSRAALRQYGRRQDQVIERSKGGQVAKGGTSTSARTRTASSPKDVHQLRDVPVCRAAGDEFQRPGGPQ